MSLKRIIYISLILVVYFISPTINAQDSLIVDFTSVINLNDTPFWIYSNNHGIFDTRSSQVLTRTQYYNKTLLSSFLKFEYGVDFIGRYGKNSAVFFNQGYITFYTERLKIIGGRFINTSPTHNSEIGMGSLGVSGNSTPIPQIRAGTHGWITIPFTWNLLELKGHIAHGWMERQNYIDKVLYHEKVGHVRVGGNLPINLYGGLAHYVLWGGDNHPKFGNLPSSIEDFARILIAVGGDENAPPGDQNYILGDHKGAWDFGFKLKFQGFDALFYRQFPLETKEELKFKAIEDGLNGISFEFKNELPLGLSNLVYEFLYTKYQRGPFRPNPENQRYPYEGNANYYNNGVYRSGWIYNGFTIGNPLFIPRDYYVGVGNNRIVAHHIGFLFQYDEKLSAKAKFTFSNNHGNWKNKVDDRPDLGRAYDPPKKQFSALISANRSFEFHEKFQTVIKMELSFDRGQLVGSNMGILTSFQILL